MRLRSWAFGALMLGFSLLGSHPALAQFHRKVRHYNAEGRPYYRGPLHLTLAGGTAFYDGDLGNNPGDNFLGPAISAGVLYRLSPHWHIGSEFSYFELGARDKAKERGLAFNSTNGMGTVFLRYDLLADQSVFAGSMADAPAFQVYVQGGAGLLLYDPRAYIGTSRANKETTYLAPERNDYPALAGVLPLGAGLGARISDRFRVNLEGNYYITSTDQLDDINLRLGGASRNLDGFATLMLKVEYSLE